MGVFGHGGRGERVEITSQANQRNGAVAKESSSREVFAHGHHGSTSHPMFQGVALSRGIESSDVLAKGEHFEPFSHSITDRVMAEP